MSSPHRDAAAPPPLFSDAKEVLWRRSAHRLKDGAQFEKILNLRRRRTRSEEPSGHRHHRAAKEIPGKAVGVAKREHRPRPPQRNGVGVLSLFRFQFVLND